MAKVKFPLMSGVAKNKVGDIVFYRRGDFGINVVRMKVTPSNPRTARQQAVRHNLKTLSGIWAGKINPAGVLLYKFDGMNWNPITISSTETFTDTEKTAWMDYIHYSKQGYKVKGRLSFIGVNMDRLYNNQEPLKTPADAFTLA